jgi:hypothetical protein
MTLPIEFDTRTKFRSDFYVKLKREPKSSCNLASLEEVVSLITGQKFSEELELLELSALERQTMEQRENRLQVRESILGGRGLCWLSAV